MNNGLNTWYLNIVLGHYYGKDFEVVVKKVCDCED